DEAPPQPHPPVLDGDLLDEAEFGEPSKVVAAGGGAFLSHLGTLRGGGRPLVLEMLEDGRAGGMGQRPHDVWVRELHVMSERHVSKNYFHIAGLSNRGTGRGSRRVASVRAGRRNAAARIRIVRGRHLISRFGWVAAASVLLLGLLARTAFAQQIEFTPKTSITPSSQVTSWVWQMAIAAGVLGVLILIGVGLGYLRFAPKF